MESHGQMTVDCGLAGPDGKRLVINSARQLGHHVMMLIDNIVSQILVNK
jgi:hypothetical protein